MTIVVLFLMDNKEMLRTKIMAPLQGAIFINLIPKEIIILVDLIHNACLVTLHLEPDSLCLIQQELNILNWGRGRRSQYYQGNFSDRYD